MASSFQQRFPLTNIYPLRRRHAHSKINGAHKMPFAEAATPCSSFPQLSRASVLTQCLSARPQIRQPQIPRPNSTAWRRRLDASKLHHRHMTAESRFTEQRRETLHSTQTIITASALSTPITPCPPGLPPPGCTILALLCVCAAIAQVAENRTEIGATLSAPLVAMAIGSFLAGMRVLPSAANYCPTYELVWQHLMPLAVSFSLLDSDMSKVFKQAGPSLGAFLLGSLSTVAGTVVAFAAVGRWMGPEGWKVAACFCASYIGGSINFAATAQGLDFGAQASSRGLLAAGMSVDNLLMAAFFSLLSLIPATWHAWGSPRGAPEAPERERGTKDAEADAASTEGDGGARRVTVETLCISLAAATSALAISAAICARQAGTEKARPQVAVIALVSSLLGTLLPKCSHALRVIQTRIRAALFPRRSLPGAQPLPAPLGMAPSRPLFSGSGLVSTTLLLLFFATIGATANIHDAVAAGAPLFAFVAILLSVHIGLLLVAGKALNIPLDVLLVASNANVGGPATAAAMATSRGWTDLIQPAVLTGTLGYAMGNPVGFFVASKVLHPLASGFGFLG